MELPEGLMYVAISTDHSDLTIPELAEFMTHNSASTLIDFEDEEYSNIELIALVYTSDMERRYIKPFANEIYYFEMDKRVLNQFISWAENHLRGSDVTEI